jgi:hypothetical protein
LLLLTLFLAHRFLSPWWCRRNLLLKRQFLQEQDGVTDQRAILPIGTAMITSNLISPITSPHGPLKNTVPHCWILWLSFVPHKERRFSVA